MAPAPSGFPNEKISRGIVFFAIALSIFAGRGATAMEAGLDSFTGKKRVLLIFATESGEPRFAGLKSEIAARGAEVEDRDLVVFEILEEGQSTRNGDPIAPHEAAALRRRFLAPQQTFAFILIGKDGGLKLKGSDPVALQEIFDRIDSMPMRKDEMRRKAQRS